MYPKSTSYKWESSSQQMYLQGISSGANIEAVLGCSPTRIVLSYHPCHDPAETGKPTVGTGIPND
jgi:hypothetical protein